MRIILLAVLLLLSSCIGASKNALNDLPSWYVNPTQNDSANLYGVGEGFTIQEASKSALNNLSSKLSVSISSDSSSLIEENKYSFNEQFAQKINEETAKITFNNYKIDKSHTDGRRFYAQIGVDKYDFIKTQTLILEKNHKRMRDLYDYSKGKNILIKRNKLAQINDLAASSSVINQILNSLNSNPNYQKNLDKYHFYHNSYNNILDKIEFFITSDDEKVKDVITKSLNSQNLKINNVKNNSKNLVILTIKTKKNSQNIYNSNITKLNLTFRLIDDKNRVLASNLIDISGASMKDNQKLSFKQALRNLDIKIQTDGILKIIGIN